MGFSFHTRNQRIRGFTIVEVFIVIGIVILIVSVAVPSLVNRSVVKDLENTATQLQSTLRSTQASAMQQRKSGSTVWGLYFNNDATAPYYAQFTGSAYSTSAETGRYKLPSTVMFATGSIPLNGTTSVTFSPLTGYPNASKTFTIQLRRYPAQSTTIEVTAYGLVQR
jgi:type II secretory pathway pseudopilin PulG